MDLIYSVRTVKRGSMEDLICIGKAGKVRIEIPPIILVKGKKSSKISIVACSAERSKQNGPILEIT